MSLDRPARTADGRGLTFEQAIEGVTAALYNQAMWPAAIAGFTEVKTGKGDTLLKHHPRLTVRSNVPW